MNTRRELNPRNRRNARKWLNANTRAYGVPLVREKADRSARRTMLIGGVTGGLIVAAVISRIVYRHRPAISKLREMSRILKKLDQMGTDGQNNNE